jgi:hypothetical protein
MERSCSVVVKFYAVAKRMSTFQFAMALSNKCHFSQPIATALTVLTQQVVAKADLFDNAICNY